MDTPERHSVHAALGRQDSTADVDPPAAAPPTQQKGPRAAPPPDAAQARARPALVRLRAGNGATHLTSRATLAQSAYLKAMAERWIGKEGEAHELDIDEDALAVLLTLMRYGAGAVPELDEPLRVKVARDADYLGLAAPLWAHLAHAAPAPPDPAAQRRERAQRIYDWEQGHGYGYYRDCGSCHRLLAHRTYHCILCDAAVAEDQTCALARCSSNNGSAPSRAHECRACGIAHVRTKDTCHGCGHVRKSFD